MAGYPPNPNAPPPQPPPTWMPAGQPMMAPAHPMNWAMLGFLSKGVGLLLVFVGTLIGVIGLNPTTSAPSQSTIDGTILATRILWTLGLAAIGLGAGIKLRYVAVTPAQDLTDGQSRVLRGAQWRNTLTFLIALVLLIVIMYFLPV
jgi:hypothetical protein